MDLLREAGVELGEEQPLRPGPPPPASEPWWTRSAAYWSGRRMSEPLLLGLDVGTTGVKAVLVDADLQPLASATRRIPTQHPQPGLGRAAGRGRA